MNISKLIACALLSVGGALGQNMPADYDAV
jgi:hypothetical protein